MSAMPRKKEDKPEYQAMKKMDELFRNQDGRSQIYFDDPWGDNIQIPHIGGNAIKGEKANAYNPFNNDGSLQDILYKGHTGQKINKQMYRPEAIQQAKEWYEQAAMQTRMIMEKHANNPAVMKAQEEKIREITSVLEQLTKG